MQRISTSMTPQNNMYCLLASFKMTIILVLGLFFCCKQFDPSSGGIADEGKENYAKDFKHSCHQTHAAEVGHAVQRKWVGAGGHRGRHAARRHGRAAGSLSRLL